MDRNNVSLSPQSGQSRHHGQLSGGAPTPLGQRQNLGVSRLVKVLMVLFLFLFSFFTMGGEASLGVKIGFSLIIVTVVLSLLWAINRMFRKGA